MLSIIISASAQKEFMITSFQIPSEMEKTRLVCGGRLWHIEAVFSYEAAVW